MCGIVGQISANQGIDRQCFQQMCDTLRHRGPDAQGLHFAENDRVALGHQRLAIIDLSDLGIQPMSNEDGSIWITFNGEIYNYRSLRSELLQRGHVFRSNTDTEVIIHAYEEWDIECLNRFRGIFAFGIWDGNLKRLLLARDQLGVKPLYFYSSAETTIFASELKAVIADTSVPRQIRLDAFSDYLSYGYVPHEKSILKDVCKLPAGHYLTVQLAQGMPHIRQYWDIHYSGEIDDEETAIQRTQSTLAEAVEFQLVSDVPVGVFLSGGIDSSAITAYSSRVLNNRLSTFTVRFDHAEYDESQYAQIVADAFSTCHEVKLVEYPSVAELIQSFALTFDEPFYDSSALPTYFLSQFARTKVKVALGGDGGDEVFAGYRWYDRYMQARPPAKHHRLSRRLALLLGPLLDDHAGSQNHLGRLSRRLERHGQSLLDIYFGLIGFLNRGAQRRLLERSIFRQIPDDHLWLFRRFWREDWPVITRLQYLDLKTYLVDDILVKVDRASMAHGLEVRVPLLDHRLVETAFSIASTIIYPNGQRKGLLKKAVANTVPSSILTTRKRGFSAPMNFWFEKGLKDLSTRLLSNGRLVQHGLVDATAIDPYLSSQSVTNIWLLLVAEMWIRYWIDSDPIDSILSVVI